MNFEQADALNEAIRTIGGRHRALAIAALAPFGIHPGHKLLLTELERGPRTQSQLAVASGYEPPTITMSVRQLEAAGYVDRTPSQTDGRAMMVELTAAGRDLLPKLKSAWTEVAVRTLADVDPRVVKEVADVLEALAASLARVEARDLPHGRSRSPNSIEEGGAPTRPTGLG
jgi:DNA-binding MarR family transcriptional regulator